METSLNMDPLFTLQDEASSFIWKILGTACGDHLCNCVIVSGSSRSDLITRHLWIARRPGNQYKDPKSVSARPFQALHSGSEAVENKDV